MYAAPDCPNCHRFFAHLFGVFVAVLISFVHPADAQVIAGCTNGALPLQAYNRTTSQYAATVDVGGLPVRGLAADDARRTLYMSGGGSLYRIPYDTPRLPVLIGPFNGDASRIDGGLAFDTVRQVLLGSTGPQLNGQASAFYEIDTATAQTRLVLDLGAGDFGGIDYDVAGDVLYGVNDSTSSSAGLTGRGLYRITLPLTPASFSRIVGPPIKVNSTLETDIDGLAVGGGKVYLCADETNWMYIFNLATGQYEAPVAQTAFGADRSSCGATYATSFFLAPRPDGAAGITPPPDCSVRAFSTASFTAQARNAGSTTLSGILLRATLPANASFVSSQPAGSINAGVLTVNIGVLNAGEAAPVTISLLPHSVGTLSLTVTMSSVEPDPDPLNNTATASTRVMPAPPTSAQAVAIASTLSGHPSSAVPGAPGLRYRDSGADSFGPPGASSDGRHVIFAAEADTAPPESQTLVMLRSNGTTQLVGRQGFFPAVPGSAAAPSDISPRLTVNNSGAWAMAGTDQGGAFIARVIGGGAALVARQGQLVLGALGDVRYGARMRSPGISDDWEVAFASSLVGLDVGSGTGEAILAHDGRTVLLRSGLDIPYGQVDSDGFETFYLARTLDIEDGPLSLSTSAVGDRFVVGAFLTGPGATDRVVIREHPFGGPAIAIQESRPISALGESAGPDAPVLHAAMSPAGAIIVGVTGLGGRYVLRDNTALARSGGPVVSGGAERWAVSGTVFLGAAANAAGDTVILGATDNTDPLRNSAAVLNSATILLREGDPVDLDANGTFDEGAYIAEFVPFRSTLATDHLIVSVRLRSERAATGCGDDDTLGYALIAVPFTPAAPFCAADFNQDGGIDGGDVEAFFVAWENADALADVNQDGGIDGADVESFFTLWEAGGCP